MFEKKIETRFRGIFLRVAHVTLCDLSPSVLPVRLPRITCRTFVPRKLDEQHEHESLESMLQRVRKSLSLISECSSVSLIRTSIPCDI